MFISSLKSAFLKLKANPVVFFFALLPEGVMTGILHLAEKPLENRLVLAFAFAIPLILICSTVSGVLCYLAIERSARGRVTSAQIYRQLWTRFPQLLFLTIITGVIFLLGFAALILPGLLFMALYSFAPFLLYRDEKKRRPWDISLYLTRSSSLVRRHKGTTIAIILTTFAIEMLSYLFSQSLGAYLGGMFVSNLARESFSLGLEVTFAMALGALCSAWLAVYFLSLEAR